MKKLKFKAALLMIVLILPLSLIPASSTQLKIALVSNNVDFEMNPSVFEIFTENGLTFDYFEQDAGDYSLYDYIIVIGGPDATGAGSLSKMILSSEAQDMLKTRRYRLMYEASDVFRDNQKIFVIAGSDREFTKVAVDQYMPEIVSKINEHEFEVPLSKNISAAQLRELIDSGEDIYLIDVRSPGEYMKSHLPGAVNITQLNINRNLHNVPRDRMVVMYCYSGRRAARVIQIFDNNGYDNVHILREYYQLVNYPQE